MKLPSRLSPASIEERWRVSLGGGYSGIAVAGGRVFTMDYRKEPLPRERVLCFDRETGRTLFVHEYPVHYGDLDHPSGPRSTPALRDGRVYTLGTLGHVFCLEQASGKVVWSADTAERYRPKLPTWGQAASPLVQGDLLVIQVGARPGGTFVALDRDTGAERWRALDERPGYSTPIAIRRQAQDELVVWTADAASGLDPGTGKARWRFPFRTSEYDVAIISPVFAGGQVFLSGYWDGTRAIRLDGSDSPVLVWQGRVPSCLMATPLYRDGFLYALDRKEGLLCLEWESGKVRWRDGHRLTPEDRNPHASLVWAGEQAAGLVVALNAEGHLVLARLSPEGYEEEGRAPILGPTWAHPAFSGQEVFARSDSELVCVRVLGD